MGSFNGNAQGGRFSTHKRDAKDAAPAWKQLLFSLLLLLDLFLLYTMFMQLTHIQHVFRASKAVNLILLAVFALGAAALIWAVIRTNAWKRLLCLFLIFCICYLIVVYSELPTIKKYRDIWIKTAMETTLDHYGLATFYFPSSVVDEILQQKEDAASKNDPARSTDPPTSTEEVPTGTETGAPTDTTELPGELEQMSEEQKQFYRIFNELDVESAEAYFKDHPDALANGYLQMLVNESSLNSDGTSIRTQLGEKVLAIDAPNQILILEVKCDGARGVLAVAKQPDRLHLFPSAKLPGYGQTAGAIAKQNDGILAMTGSGFIDEGGVGNGGQIAGWAMCGGKSYGSHFGWGYKRLELHENNWFYITNSYDSVGDDTTDAMEFRPAMIVNGDALDIEYWTDLNPRACIGQSKTGEILMLCVEGRGAGGSWGCSLAYCRETLLQHDCLTAMNCDGGTTAIMWYRGEPIMRCSNASIPQGRYLPNAWVYVGE